jgi:uncharacterized delta-60 repeat protein
MVSVQQSRRSYRPAVEALEGRMLLSAGDLDPTFGTGGKLTTGFTEPTDSMAVATAVQPDGKIVVVGKGGMTRYNPNGSLDAGFGSGGQVAQGPLPWDAVALQPDGKIVVARAAAITTITGGNPPIVQYQGVIAVSRYNADGSSNTGWDISIDNSSIGPAPDAILVQPDGKIVVVSQAVTARNNPDGNPDAGFGSGGKVSEGGDAAALEPDGKILLAVGGGLVRLNADGSVDTSFGTQGVATALLPPNSSAVGQAVAVQPDGKIVLGQTVVNLATNAFALAVSRFNAAGSLDAGFGTQGTILTTTSTGSNAFSAVSGLVIEGTGRIVVADAVNNGSPSLVLFGYTSAGALDGGFGTGGQVATPLTWSGVTGAGALALDGSNLVVVGQVMGPQVKDFGVSRYTASGSPDATFGTGGTVTTAFTVPVRATAAGAVLQSDGKVIVAGTVTSLSNPVATSIGLVRYNPDGTFDAGFGSGGRVTTHTAANTVDAAGAIGIQPGGRIIVAGSSALPGVPGQQRLLLLGYLPDGRLDPAFGTGGEVLTDNLAGAAFLAIAPDGEITVGGDRRGGQGAVGFVVRYTSDGRLEFGPVDVSLAGVNGMQLQADGKLLLVGPLPGDTVPPAFALTRLDHDGSVDTSFGTNGIAATQIGAATVTLQPDGRIVVAGAGGLGLGVARYLPGGQADPTFGMDGLSAPFGRTTPAGNAVVVQPNGLIVAAGVLNTPLVSILSNVAVLTPDGSPDTAFGKGGTLLSDFANSEPVAVLYQPDGKLVVVSTTDVTDVTGSNSTFALARFQADTASPVVPPSDPDHFAGAVYHDLLNRAPTATELEAVEAPLDAARLPLLSSAALAYVASSENRGHVIAGYYQQLLGRTASPGEIQSWLPPQQNVSPDQVLPLILGSEEYFQKHGHDNASWLAAVYHDLLGRTPDPGSQPWLDALNRGTPRSQVAAGLTASPEYGRDVITQLYATDLGRSAGAGDVAVWLPVLTQPVPPGGGPGPTEQFRAGLLVSPEYFHGHGNSDPGWVDSLYTHLLGRLPDALGAATTLQAVRIGYIGPRQAAAATLLAGDEYKRDLVSGYYNQYLNRSASPGEIDGWVQLLRQGATDEQILASIVSSDEYYKRAGGGTDATWLDALYRDLLGRPRNGDNSLLPAVQAPGGRLLVANAVLSSQEYRQHLIQTFYLTYLDRQAAAAEAAGWVQVLNQGTSDEGVQAARLGAPEYLARPRQLP